MGLEGLICRPQAGVLHGIVNGIDTEVWNPATDPLLAAPFSAKKLDGRAAQPRRASRRASASSADGSPLLRASSAG